MKENKRRPAASRLALAAAAAAAVAVPVAAVAAPGGYSSQALLPSQVRVINGVKQPVPVAPQGVQKETAAGELMSATDPMTMAPDDTMVTRPLITVPAGKLFVIEYVSGAALAPDTSRLQVRIGGETGPLIRPPVHPGFGPNEPGLIRGTFSEEVKLVVNGPGTVQAQIQRFGGGGTAAGMASPITVTGTMYDCATCV